MVETGHLLIDSDGAVVSMDAAFCDIMHMNEQALRGRAILDVTAPADRQECGQALARLQSTGRPFCVTKRFLRDDGTLIWVKNTVSLIAGGKDSGTIMATVEPVVVPQDDSPATLLEAARAHIVTRRERSTVGDAKLFSEPGWDTVLAVYVAEAEGRAIDATMLADLLGNSQAVTERWLKALLHHGIVELEYRRPDALAPKSYRLTAATHRKLETFLGRHLMRYRARLSKAA